MDALDDILSEAPAAPARPRSKFMPKAKTKQLPRKEISASEHATATSSKDGKNLVPIASSATSTNSGGILNQCHNAGSSNLEDATNNEMGNHQQVSVVRDGEKQPIHPANAVENDLNTVAAQSTTYSSIKTMEEPPNSGECSIPDSNRSLEHIDSSLQVIPDASFKSALDNKAAIIESNIHSNLNSGREQESVSGECEWNPFSDVLPDPGTRNARKFQPKIKPRPRVSNASAIASASSSVMMEKSAQLPASCTNEAQSFQSSGDGIGGQNPFSEDKKNLASVIPSEPDSLNAMLSEVTVLDGTRDPPSSFGKPAAETADIYSGLESLDDILTPATTDTGKPVVHSINEKRTAENCDTQASGSIHSFGVCGATHVQRNPDNLTTQGPCTLNEAAVFKEDDIHTNIRRSETEEVVDLNRARPIGDAFDYRSIDSVTDPTSEIPVNEELTNAADSPTLADVLHKDVTVEKKDANKRKRDSSLRKHRRSPTTGVKDKGGKTARQLRKNASREPANSSLNEDVHDDDDDDDIDPLYNYNIDELEENDDEDELDNLSKKKRASTSSKKKSVAKNGKTSQKRKQSNDDLENTTDKPPKKFSHSTRRRKRCVDKALLEKPEDELDPRTLPIKDLILLAEYRERLAKKEATTSKTSSTNQSGGDYFHEASANYEEDTRGSEDLNDNQDTEKVTDTSALINYQSFMDKAPRGKWSKQDTELFYEAVREFGTDFSMIQQLFPDRTRHQIKLKYKKEERQHPLQLSDAVNSRSKDLSHFKKVIDRLQQASAKAEQDPNGDVSNIMTEEVEDLTPENNEEVATTEKDTEEVETTKQETHLEDQEEVSAALDNPEQTDDNDDDDDDYSQIWSYTSDFL